MGSKKNVTSRRNTIRKIGSWKNTPGNTPELFRECFNLWFYFYGNFRPYKKLASIQFIFLVINNLFIPYFSIIYFLYVFDFLSVSTKFPKACIFGCQFWMFILHKYVTNNAGQLYLAIEINLREASLTLFGSNNTSKLWRLPQQTNNSLFFFWK